MRVLLTTDLIGGVWTFTRELTHELLNMGHEVAVVSLSHRPSSAQSAWCAGTAQQYAGRFRHINRPAPLEWMAQNESAYSAAESALLRLIEQFKPDILHCSQFCFGRLPAAVPAIVTAHSDVFTWACACRPETLHDSSWLTCYGRLVQDGLTAAAAVVAPTHWMLEALAAHVSLPQVRRVIFNGRTLPDLHTVAERSGQAVSAGRLWDESKNLQLLTRVRAPMPIIVAGPVTPDFDDDNEPTPGIVQGEVTYMGTLEEAELLALFRRSAIYIAPSRYEPFGLAPLEAALCGCALVANDIASFREIWGDAALYFERNDASSLSDLLALLHASPALLAAARARCLQRALQLSARRMAEAYVHLYTEVLQGDDQLQTRESANAHAL